MISVLFFTAGIAILVFTENLLNHTSRYNPEYEEPGKRRVAAFRLKGIAAFMILIGLVLLLKI